MQLVKIIKKTNNRIDQARVILSIFTFLSDMKLSDVDLLVLAYYMVYGINRETEDLIVKSQILKADSLANTKSKLKNFGLIKKHPMNRSYALSEKLSVKLDAEIALLIKVDNK